MGRTRLTSADLRASTAACDQIVRDFPPGRFEFAKRFLARAEELRAASDELQQFVRESGERATQALRAKALEAAQRWLESAIAVATATDVIAEEECTPLRRQSAEVTQLIESARRSYENGRQLRATNEFEETDAMFRAVVEAYPSGFDDLNDLRSRNSDDIARRDELRSAFEQWLGDRPLTGDHAERVDVQALLELETDRGRTDLLKAVRAALVDKLRRGVTAHSQEPGALVGLGFLCERLDTLPQLLMPGSWQAVLDNDMTIADEVAAVCAEVLAAVDKAQPTKPRLDALTELSEVLLRHKRFYGLLNCSSPSSHPAMQVARTIHDEALRLRKLKRNERVAMSSAIEALGQVVARGSAQTLQEWADELRPTMNRLLRRWFQ